MYLIDAELHLPMIQSLAWESKHLGQLRIRDSEKAPNPQCTELVCRLSARQLPVNKVLLLFHLARYLNQLLEHAIPCDLFQGGLRVTIRLQRLRYF